MKENKKYFIISGVLFVLFILFTILVKTVDVQAIGPEGSQVGFASINAKVASVLAYNEVCYKVSEILGYLAIATVLVFGLFGAMQLFIKKGFSKVDKDLYVLLGLYVLVLAIYVVFEKVIINYRPVILDEGLEASYPSSHTMLAVAFVSAAVVEFSARLKKKMTRNIVVAACVIDGIGVILFRVLAGVHWITDIFASILISGACLMLFIGAFNIVISKKKEVEK